LLEKTPPAALARLLQENADEPQAGKLADALAGEKFTTTQSLATAIRAALPHLKKDDADLTVRRVFQALRIAVNDEFSALDMRMNPQRGFPASALLEKTSPAALARLLQENADEPQAGKLADALAGKKFTTTKSLATAICAALPRLKKDDADLTVRRVFQALRIAVNDEFSALDMLLRHLPACLNPGGRVAILTFHSGEDRRVKKAFEAGFRDGHYADIARDIIRPTPGERRDNPRSSPAKLRWARKADSPATPIHAANP